VFIPKIGMSRVLITEAERKYVPSPPSDGYLNKHTESNKQVFINDVFRLEL
jgi:hypothetical protein